MRKNRKKRTSTKILNVTEWQPNHLGQHFMHNRSLLHEIVNKANIHPQDTVLEFGAGKGALTIPLAAKARKVIAVEIDDRLVELLDKKMAKYPNVKIIHQDILNFRLPKEKFIVVSNIPYAITTPILRLLLDDLTSGFQHGVIVMEKGAAKRFTSKIIKDAYVISWRMIFQITYVRSISRNCFHPQPRVDSALVRITRRAESLISKKDLIHFQGLAEHVLKKHDLSFEDSLRGIFTAPQIVRLRRTLGIKPGTPFSMLSEKEWQIVYQTMVELVPRQLWPRAKRSQEWGNIRKRRKKS